MIIRCLVIKTYRGTTVAVQRRIVQDLGGTLNGRSCTWDIIVPDIVEDIKGVERALGNKVPYIKNPSNEPGR